MKQGAFGTELQKIAKGSFSFIGIGGVKLTCTMAARFWEIKIVR